MAKSIRVIPKKRGRPATGKDPLIALRSPQQLTAAIDKFAEDQKPALSRSEAVRVLLTDQLTTLGILPHREDPEGAN